MPDLSKRILCLCLLVGLLAGCGPQPTPVPTSPVPPSQAPTSAPTAVPTAVPPTAAPTRPRATVTPAGPARVTPPPISGRFAPYRVPEVQAQPSVSHEAIAPDLSNVISSFLLSPQQRERLAQNGFTVSPSEHKEFYILYEQARYNNEPVFVTSDSLLHMYHLLFDKVLRTTERQQLIPILQRLNRRMLGNSEKQYEQLQGTALEEHARRNVAFFAVGSRLLNPQVQIPDYVTDLVEGELALIEAHDGFWPSPIFPALPYGEDYTQYIPRGHYTLGEDLQAYFRSMMWYGRMTFRIIKPEDPDGREETRRALLLVQALASDPEAMSLWQAIYEPTVFFVGRSDDLLYSEYMPLVQDVYGGIPTDPAAFADEEKLTEFMEKAMELRPPRILGIVVDVTMDEEETTKGMRLMGQRFVPDSYVLGLLIDDKVPDRFPPKGLDVLAVMGSERAYAILEEEGDTGYPRYVENLTELQDEFATYTRDDWTQNLYWSWLYLFFPLMEPAGEGYPQFMRSQAWLDKSLNTVLGSWAELRHDTILYAKQAYAELGAGPEPPRPEPPKGYVEPVPEFYARLNALAVMTREGLLERGLLNDDDDYSLQQLEWLTRSFKDMAEKELAGQPLSEQDYTTIRFYGGTLENLTFAAAEGGAPYGGEPSAEEEPQAAVIADVATHPGIFQVLEVGIGRIYVIYAIVPIEGELVVTKGGVFSYYEFPWAMDDRLTDEKWREMLDSGAAPALPPWTASFIVEETEEAALRSIVWQFNMSLIDALWYVEAGSLASVATGEALQRNQAYVQSLADEMIMEGYHLIRLEFLSYDLQGADRAIVTTRETWDAQRYERGYYGEPGDLRATRPAHTVGVIYGLQRVNGRWMVSQVQVQGEVPAWEAVTP